VIHGHDVGGADLIVCWEHNWPECPLEVVELRKAVSNQQSAFSQNKKPLKYGGTEEAEENLTTEEHGVDTDQAEATERLPRTNADEREPESLELKAQEPLKQGGKENAPD